MKIVTFKERLQRWWMGKEKYLFRLREHLDALHSMTQGETMFVPTGQYVDISDGKGVFVQTYVQMFKYSNEEVEAARKGIVILSEKLAYWETR